MASQADLFGAELLRSAWRAGLSLSSELLGAAEERALTRHIDAEGLEPFRFGQWTGKRLTRSFGWHYDFSGGGLGRGDPMPEWLLPIRAQMAKAFGEDAERYEQALLIRYDPGAGIGWHRDRPQFERIMGLSLGVGADLRLRRRRDKGFERRSVPLIPRQAYRLAGEARREWEHSIVPGEETRWSVTFRSLVRDGRAQSR